MTVARVSPGDPDPVGAVAEGGQDKFRIHPCRTRDPYDPDIVRILEAAYTGEIGGTITAPVTEKRRDLRLPVVHILSSLQEAV
jgi:hypothetical protein